jgi:hypothetical protein
LRRIFPAFQLVREEHHFNFLPFRKVAVHWFSVSIWAVVGSAKSLNLGNQKSQGMADSGHFGRRS